MPSAVRRSGRCWPSRCARSRGNMPSCATARRQRRRPCAHLPAPCASFASPNCHRHGPLGMAAAIVNTVVGAGIFRLPASMYAAVGAYAPLAYLLCAVVMGGVVICFAEGGSRVPTSGGTYGYVEAAFGPGVGFLSGVLLWFSGVLALGGIAAAVADGLVTLLPSAWARVAHAAVIIVSISGVAALNIRGAVTGTRFIGVATLIKLTPLLIFLIAGATAWHGLGVAASAPSSQGFGRALILAV